MVETFKGWPKWLQIVLLAIPAVNWVVEIILRIFAVIKKASIINIVMLVIAAIGGGFVLGWIDCVLVGILGGDFLLME